MMGTTFSYAQTVCLAVWVCAALGCNTDSGSGATPDVQSTDGADGLDGFASSDISDVSGTTGTDIADASTDGTDAFTDDVQAPDIEDGPEDIQADVGTDGEPDVQGDADGADTTGGDALADADGGDDAIDGEPDTGTTGEDTTDGGDCTTASGDDCAQARCLDNSVLPVVFSGDTSTLTPQLNLGDSECATQPDEIWGIASSDMVFEFTAPVTNSYSAQLEPDGFDAVLYVRSTCDDGSTTLACDDTQSTETVELELTAGETVYFVVDGRFNGTDASGPFTLTITDGCLPQCAGKTCIEDDGCGQPCGCPDGEACVGNGTCQVVGAGDTCDVPFDATIGVVSGDTSTAQNDYSSLACGDEGPLGGGSKDDAWALPTVLNAQYTVTLDPNFDGAVYAVTTCGNPSSGCLDAADDGGSTGTDQIEFLGTGDTVYLIVDGYSNSSDLSGSYSMTIDECVVSCENKGCNDDNGCGVACGCAAGFCDPASGECVDALPGNQCDAANEITQFGVALPGDTTSASNDYSFDSCGGTSNKGGASNDQVWFFEADPGATYTITLAPNGWDPVLYAIAGSDCTNIDASCLDASDSGASGSSEEIVVTAPLDGGTIYVFVDGYSDFSNLNGSYTLTVSEPCQPSCEGQPCNGTNGCGGSCGCPAGLLCNGGSGECVEPSSGDVCDTAFEVTEFGVPLAGDTGVSYPDYFFDDCPGTTSGKGDASNDQVWFFETDPGATYTITLDPDGWDPVLYAIVAEDCSDIDSTCLGSADGAGSSGNETITVTAPLDGGIMYIFVDGYSTFSNLNGPYTLTVSEPCLPDCSGAPCTADNGCGTTCGCATGEACEPVSGECVDASLGATCETAFEVEEFGVPLGGDTSLSTGNYEVESSCEGISSNKGGASNDHVWTFETEPGAIYTVSLNPDGWDPVLYVGVGPDCSDVNAICLGADDGSGWSGVESVTVAAPPEGGTAWIFVDGYSGFSNLNGPYTLTVSEPCIPSCDGLECGSDGCGGTCGTCPSGICESGTCAGPPPEECTPVGVVTCGETVLGISQTSNSSNAFSGYTCQSFSSDNYANSFEVTYIFEADFNGAFSVDGLDDGSMDVTILKDDGGGCVDSGSNCIDNSTSDTTVAVQEGDVFYIVWDSFSTTPQDPFGMAIECCQASCDGKECGSDGCGGTCGTCETGTLCDENINVCVDISQGSSCDVPNELEPGTTVAGNTELASNDYSIGSCPASTTSSKGEGSNDQVWTFEAEPGATYTVTLDPDGWDPALYVLLNDCTNPDATCLGLTDSGASSGDETITFTAPLDGGIVYVVVDGYSNFSNLNGAYNLTLSEPCLPNCDGSACNADNGCGTQCGCPTGELCDANLGECVDVSVGDTCVDPFVYDDFGQPVTGNTELSLGDYQATSQCPGLWSNKGGASNDQVWLIDTVPSGVYTATLDPDGWDPVLYVFAGDTCEPGEFICLGGDDGGGSGSTEEVVFTAPPEGGPVYIVVDGFSGSSNLNGPYTLTINEPCIPSCAGLACNDDNGCGTPCGCPDPGLLCDSNLGECVDISSGDTCETPFVYENFGQPVTGNTELSVGDYEATSQCPGLFSNKGGASNDQVWIVDTVPSGVYTATLDPQGWDPVLYVFAGDTCEPGEFTCLGGDDGSGSSGTEEVVFTAPPEGGPVYVVVDGWSGTSNLTGPYTLTINEPCIPSCDGALCTDDDGCGAECGCPAGNVCIPDGSCIDASEGDSCETPFEVTDLDTPLPGNTAQSFADYGFDSCPGSTSKGDGSNDQVWTYEVSEGASYTVTLNPDGWDAALYVIVADDCTNIDGTCVGADDTGLSSGAETVTFTATASGLMFIFVDGWSNSSNQSGPYTITVSESF